jgi:hypothetical protein
MLPRRNDDENSEQNPKPSEYNGYYRQRQVLSMGSRTALAGWCSLPAL